MTIKRTCIKCKNQVELKHVTEDLYWRWRASRDPIQVVMKDVPKEEREMFLSGICSECWDQIFPRETGMQDTL